MVQTKSLLDIQMKREDAVALIETKMMDFGLKVTRSFDFQLSRDAHADCKCPHHGTEQCDCTVTIFIISAKDIGTATLKIHSRDGWIQIEMVNPPDVHPAEDLVNVLRMAVGELQGAALG